MSDQPREELEATLDQYLTEPNRVEEFVLQQAHRAPWWAISFLVHLILLLVLWRWPLPAMGTTTAIARPDITDVGFVKPPPPPIIDPRRPAIVEPPPKPELRNEEPLRPKLTPTPQPKELVKLPGVPDPGDLTPGEPIEPLPPLAQLSIIHVAVPNGPPGRKNLFINRPPGIRGTPGDSIGGRDRYKRPYGPIRFALIWLAHAQLHSRSWQDDGCWDAERWGGAKPYRVGSTGLTLLAFLGAGYTHKKGDFKTTVYKGVRWLRLNQKDDGSFGWTTFYEQGIATMAVCEAYALTGDPDMRHVAQRAVNYIVRLQPEHGGFRYQGAVAEGKGDMSVTGWQIMALKSAIAAGLRVPQAAVDRSHRFLANSARRYGASAYLVGKEGAGSLAMTSVGMLCRVFLDDRRYDGEILQSGKYLINRETRNLRAVPGGATKELVRDLYYTYYSSLAMFQMGGEFWRLWRAMFLERIVSEQIRQRSDSRGRFVQGSWEPTRHRWGKAGGRVYTTAMAAMTLEVPFRYLRLYRQ